MLINAGILVSWLALYLVNIIGGLFQGVSTAFLPISLALMLIQELSTRRRPFDLSPLFLVSCLFFFSINLILWPFTSLPPTQFESLIITSFTLEELDFAAFLTGLSIAITMLTFAVRRRALSHAMPPVFGANLGRERPGLYRFGLFLMAASLIPVLNELWGQVVFIQAAGYLTLFTSGLSTSAFITFFFYLFNFGFGLALAFVKNRKNFAFPAILYLIVATLDALKGSRGAVLVPLLFVTWFYISRFNVKINIVAVARNAVLLVGAFVFLTYLRDPAAFSAGFGQSLVDSMSTQGRSLQLTILYQRNFEAVSQYGSYMVLSNLFIPITAVLHPEVREAAQSIDQVIYSNNLKHILTYVLNPEYYLAGGGTGGVYTIELIESGPVAYVLLSILLGLFLIWLPSAMRHPWVRFMSIYFFTTVFYLPRGELFFNTLILGKAILLYLIAIAIFDSLNTRKYSKLLAKSMTQTDSKTLL